MLDLVVHHLCVCLVLSLKVVGGALHRAPGAQAIGQMAPFPLEGCVCMCRHMYVTCVWVLRELTATIPLCRVSSCLQACSTPLLWWVLLLKDLVGVARGRLRQAASRDAAAGPHTAEPCCCCTSCQRAGPSTARHGVLQTPDATCGREFPLFPYLHAIVPRLCVCRLAFFHQLSFFVAPHSALLAGMLSGVATDSVSCVNH